MDKDRFLPLILNIQDQRHEREKELQTQLKINFSEKSWEGVKAAKMALRDIKVELDLLMEILKKIE